MSFLSDYLYNDCCGWWWFRLLIWMMERNYHWNFTPMAWWAISKAHLVIELYLHYSTNPIIQTSFFLWCHSDISCLFVMELKIVMHSFSSSIITVDIRFLFPNRQTNQVLVEKIWVWVNETKVRFTPVLDSNGVDPKKNLILVHIIRCV